MIAGLQRLLRSGEDVSVSELAITLRFHGGVIVECERCAVIWRVPLGQFHHAATWECPLGCDRFEPPSTAVVLPRH
jgi:hypothetical protein